MPDPKEPQARLVKIPADPAQVLRAWPADRPLAVLWSAAPGSPDAARWSRWSVFAQPVGCVRTESEGTRPERTRTRWHGPSELAPPIADAADPLAAIAAAETTARVGTARTGDPGVPPFLGGWIGSLSYELGRVIEPAAASQPKSAHPRAKQVGSPWPRAILHRCPAAYVHDRLTGRWWVVGDRRWADVLPGVELLAREARQTEPVELGFDDDSIGIGSSNWYIDAVERVVQYIRAGDVFQANLARLMSGAFSGSVRELFGAMVAAASPWYGAYVEDRASPRGQQAALSMSPELFLDFEPGTRMVTTRPIKGTRRGEAGDGALAASAKDAAELAMIVDLMRNDLGRVCEFGSMRVAEERALELHARGVGSGLFHGVATVEGRLRAGLGIADLLRATFPGGSVTGAPKIRAMQIINQLELSERGPYTGSIGYLSDCGRACMNIAIRTAHVVQRFDDDGAASDQDAPTKGSWQYHTGAGIVADSDPVLEWDETLAKAEIMQRMAREFPMRVTVPVQAGSTG